MKNKVIGLCLLGLASLTAMVTLSQNVEPLSKRILASYKASRYYCSDICLGENVVSSIIAYADLDTETKLSKVVHPFSLLFPSEYTLTNFSNANYKASQENIYYPLKIGGTSSGKYSGSFTLTFLGQNVICKRAIIYACGYSGDGGQKSKIYMSINESDEQEINLIENDEYVFYPYTFENINSNTLTFFNNKNATGKRRILISKIVLRLGEQ